MMVSGGEGGSVSKERIEMAQPQLPEDSYSTQIYPRSWTRRRGAAFDRCDDNVGTTVSLDMVTTR
jgi:hypothetical protein